MPKSASTPGARSAARREQRSDPDLAQLPVIVLSAHGVAPSVYRRAAARGLTTIDATCPLVMKVHVQARRYAAEGCRVVLIGHSGHEEVVGTMGEAPESTILKESWTPEDSSVDAELAELYEVDRPHAANDPRLDDPADRAAVAALEGVLERIGQQLIDDQPRGHCDVAVLS